MIRFDLRVEALVAASSGNAVKDFGSRIRKNLDFLVSRRKSYDFRYVRYPAFFGV